MRVKLIYGLGLTDPIPEMQFYVNILDVVPDRVPEQV